MTVIPSYLLDLQARAQAADEVSAMRSHQSSDASPSVVDDHPAKEDDDWWYKGMDTLLLPQFGERHYVGTASSIYLAQKLNPTPNTNLAWDVHPMYKDPSSLRRPPGPILPQLPPFEFAKRLYHAQYIYIGTIFSFLQPHTFEARLKHIYDQAPDLEDREECLAFCQILLIFAYGQMYSVNQWSGTDGPPGFTYFKQALWLLPDIHQAGSILFVEVLGLLAPYLQNLNRRDAAFLYIGSALRMAISLGLHQEVDDPSMDLIEREHRRRVWWSVYSMDRILSVKSGNPISIDDDDIDVAWPAPIPGVDPNLSPPRVLAHYTQLSRILGRIGEGIYRKKDKSGTSLLTSVQSIMTELFNWLKQLPAELRVNLSALDRPLSRENVSTALHYYQCVIMTGRPLLLYVSQRRLEAIAHGSASANWKEGLSSNIVAAIDNTIAAARASAMIMKAAADQDMLATYGFMDGEHAFSASLTLVMVNVAFPHNERDAQAMELALSVLRGMAAKGNEHIQSRLALLMNLFSTKTHTNFQSDDTTRAAPVPAFNYPGPALGPTFVVGASNFPPSTEGAVPFVDYFQPFQDISFDFDVNDDPQLWSEISANIDIDMETGWIQNALQTESNQPQ